jgi:hypothetical protein
VKRREIERGMMKYTCFLGGGVEYSPDGPDVHLMPIWTAHAFLRVDQRPLLVDSNAAPPPFLNYLNS